MSRLKQNQNIDNLISSINIIAKNQCSLSELDVNILNEAVTRLQCLRKKKGRTNEAVLTEIVKIIQLLSSFFL